MKWVLASSNMGKLKEIQDLLAPLGLELVPQSDLSIDDAEETGLSFVENAIIKARHAAKASGFPALADDSGLEVDALQGAPGIYSARYAGAGATDAANCTKLLEALAEVPAAQRTARFRCVLVLVRHALDPAPLIAEGVWEGIILHECRGTQGFGYDPLFYIPALDASSAQLERSLKNSLSHRAQALQRLVELIRHDARI